MTIDPTIQFIYVDLFCGAGGTSTGVEDAKALTYSDRKKSNRVIEEQIAYRKANGIKCAKVIGCVNHDANAIASHAANHPEALHFTEDIRTLVLDRLIAHVEAMRIKYPNAKLVLWASLECTNFSKAKGGMARNADSRTLAEHLFRYIDALKPDYIQIENVEEFMSWGDLDEKGKPISKTNGIHYQKWVSNVKAYGYDFDHRILNSADFGAYTSRKRFFGIFAKDGLPIVFPKPTHCKGGSNNMFDSLLKWKPVKECLDFSDEGKSIFDRPKDLVENSLDRILSGLVKFVAGGKDKWLMKYNSVNGNTGKHNPPSVDEPCFTLIARMDKMPPYLIEATDDTRTIPSFIKIVGDTIIYEIYDTDSPKTKEIKEFMALYGIIDIKMRMLNIPELKMIMGFPKDYVLVGTQADQKKFIGNAVEVNMARAMCEALADKLLELKKQAA